MRKIANFLVSVIVFVVFFSCNFNDYKLPTALEIYGNPELTFSAKKDIGALLEEQLENNDFDLITCTNTSIRTHIFSQSIFTDGFNLSKPSYFPEDGIATINADYPIDANDITIKIDFSEVLPGFELKPVKARLYIYGSNLNEKIKIEITGEDFNFNPFDFNKESVSFNNNMFSGTGLPGRKGDELTLTLSGEQTIHFSVIIPEHTEVDSALFKETLKADLLIWLPLEFVASPGDAQILFPEGFLFSGGDLFGRGKPDDSNPISDFIESLELSINLKENAFKGRELIIWSQPGLTELDPDKDIIIRRTLTENAFIIPFDSETMKKINDPANYPFSPRFLFEYEKDEELIIPREFVSTEFVFKAKVNFRKEF